MKTRIQFVRLAWEPIGLVGEIEVEDKTVEEAFRIAFDSFNRGSNREVEFDGPSASVGDLFVLTNDGDTRFMTSYEIAPVGFNKLAGKFARLTR